MRALVVGCGTGFVPACLSAMGASVRAIEIHAELAQAAQRNLKRAGFGQVEVVTGDTFNLDIGQGLCAHCGMWRPAPVRRIVSLARWPWVGSYSSWSATSLPQEALLVTRTAGTAWSSMALFETAVDPLENATRPERFQF